MFVFFAFGFCSVSSVSVAGTTSDVEFFLRDFTAKADETVRWWREV